MNSTVSPARVARAAMQAVEERRRGDWLDLFTADAYVEDPVGHVSPILGRDALADFWDGAIDQLASTRFTISRVWETSTEAMVLATVLVSIPSGATAEYVGTFNYRVTANGAIAVMRAFWDLPAVLDDLSA